MKKLLVSLFSSLMLVSVATPMVTHAATLNDSEIPQVTSPATVEEVASVDGVLASQVKLTMWTMPGRDPHIVTVNAVLPVTTIETYSYGNYTCYMYKDANGTIWDGKQYLP